MYNYNRIMIENIEIYLTKLKHKYCHYCSKKNRAWATC